MTANNLFAFTPTILYTTPRAHLPWRRQQLARFPDYYRLIYRATRVNLTPALKDGTSMAQGSSPQLRDSRLLIVGQVALSTLLLTGTGLLCGR